MKNLFFPFTYLLLCNCNCQHLKAPILFTLEFAQNESIKVDIIVIRYLLKRLNRKLLINCSLGRHL